MNEARVSGHSYLYQWLVTGFLFPVYEYRVQSSICSMLEGSLAAFKMKNFSPSPVFRSQLKDLPAALEKHKMVWYALNE